MTIENLIAVLGWSMVVNFGIFLVWIIFMKAMPELTYKTQTWVTNISREEFESNMYKMMGQYKIALLVTHFGPYMALRIVYT